LAETYVDRFGDDEQRLQPPPDPELLAMIETVKAERRAAVGCKPAPVVRPFRRDHHRLWRAAAVGVALGAAACGGCWAVVSH
jgi:hypothetical protein